MSDKQHILVVDDESFNFDMIELAIGERYRLEYAASGEEALERAAAEPPEAILLDIRLPGMDGYQVCRELRQKVESPVIFISGLDSLEERLAGYEAGASDYITKPFAADELERKVALTLRYREEKAALRDQASAAMDTAMVAITSAGELGVVLQFLGKSFTCRSLDELAKEVLDAMEEYSLECAVQLRGDGQVVNLAYGTVVSPLEIAVLDRMEGQRRILDFGRRTAINYPHVSLLIKNMPLDDPDSYGRIKDNVALLVEGSESRVRAMELEAQARRRKEALTALVRRTEQALHDIDQRHRHHKEASTAILEDLLERLEESFMTLGLSDPQEQELMALTNDAVHRALALYDDGLAVDQHLDSVVSELRQATEAH